MGFPSPVADRPPPSLPRLPNGICLFSLFHRGEIHVSDSATHLTGVISDFRPFPDLRPPANTHNPLESRHDVGYSDQS